MVWVGGSSKMMTPGGISMSHFDHLEDRASTRDVSLGVQEALLDVLEAAHREEVVVRSL